MAGREEHVAAFLEYSIALPQESTKAWTQLCSDWENDRQKPNPFVVPKLRMFRVIQLCVSLCTDGLYLYLDISDKEVRLRLAQEDADALTAGKATMIQDGISPSVLIYQGLEIEDLQYVCHNLIHHVEVHKRIC
jgi:hypothetical protein